MNTHIVDPKAEKGKTAWNYIWKYKTPEGFDDLVMCGDGEALTGLWFEGSRDDRREAGGCEKRETLAGAEISG